MTEEVEEKDVFPGLALVWTGFDLGEVDAALGKRLQHAAEDSGLILDREEHRSLVAPRTVAPLAGDHQKTGKIVDLVLDPAPDDLEVVERGGQLAGYGSRSIILADNLGRDRGGCDINHRNAGQVVVEPLTALGNRLGMRVDLLDVLHPAGAGQQVVVHLQKNLGGDLQFTFNKHVKGMGDDTFRRVLDRHDPVQRLPFFDLFKNSRD